jgi:ribosome-associated translation inhibitor RaiA
MNPTDSEVIFSSAGFAPGEDLNALVTKKSALIFRHTSAQVSAIRVHAIHENAQSGSTEFVVRVTCKTPGKENTVHARSVRPSTAITLGFAKMERMLTSAFRMRKQQEHHPLAIVLRFEIPKA